MLRKLKRWWYRESRATFHIPCKNEAELIAMFILLDNFGFLYSLWGSPHSNEAKKENENVQVLLESRS